MRMGEREGEGERGMDDGQSEETADRVRAEKKKG